MKIFKIVCDGCTVSNYMQILVSFCWFSLLFWQNHSGWVCHLHNAYSVELWSDDDDDGDDGDDDDDDGDGGDARGVDDKMIIFKMFKMKMWSN